jgi:hypothetical protein
MAQFKRLLDMIFKVKCLAIIIFVLITHFSMSEVNEKFSIPEIYFLWSKKINKEVFFEKDLILEKEKTDAFALARVTKTTYGIEYSIVEVLSTSNNYPLIGQVFKRDFRSHWSGCDWVLVSFKEKKIHNTSYLYYRFNPKTDEPISYKEIKNYIINLK